MSTIELRNKLIEKIQVIDDDLLLEEAGRLFEIEGADSEVYILSESQKEAIAIARKQIAEGDYFTDEEVNREIDEWLNK